MLQQVVQGQQQVQLLAPVVLLQALLLPNQQQSLQEIQH